MYVTLAIFQFFLHFFFLSLRPGQMSGSGLGLGAGLGASSHKTQVFLHHLFFFFSEYVDSHLFFFLHFIDLSAHPEPEVSMQVRQAVHSAARVGVYECLSPHTTPTGQLLEHASHGTLGLVEAQNAAKRRARGTR